MDAKTVGLLIFTAAACWVYCDAKKRVLPELGC